MGGSTSETVPEFRSGWQVLAVPAKPRGAASQATCARALNLRRHSGRAGASRMWRLAEGFFPTTVDASSMRLHSLSPAGGIAAAAGKLMSMPRPPRGPGLTVRLPWWALVMAVTMDRPRPRPSVPAGRLPGRRWKGWSSWVAWLAGMTGPVAAARRTLSGSARAPGRPGWRPAARDPGAGRRGPAAAAAKALTAGPVPGSGPPARRTRTAWAGSHRRLGPGRPPGPPPCWPRSASGSGSRSRRRPAACRPRRGGFGQVTIQDDHVITGPA